MYRFPSESHEKKYAWRFFFQIARQEITIVCLQHGQRRREEDAEEVAAERISTEGSRASGWAEAVQEEKRETRLATGGESKFPKQGRENRENLLPSDNRSGLIKATGRIDDVQATTVAEARAAPEVPRCWRGGVHLCWGEDERGEADEDASVSSRRLLREYDVRRRFVGLGQAEGHKKEAEEEEATHVVEEAHGEPRNRAKQARLQREDFTQQHLTIIFFKRAAKRIIIRRISNNLEKSL